MFKPSWFHLLPPMDKVDFFLTQEEKAGSGAQGNWFYPGVN
jgi:hypothetical protein